MADKNILHMITPLKHMSPFDVNMALDAGFDAVTAYTQVTLDEVTGLVQDAIFSRPPKSAVRTGLFIAGKDAILALDMLDKARSALFPPFQINLFADPAGSFTTAAAMVAKVAKVLREKKQQDLKGRRVAVFGATGVVGFSSAVIAALDGADVTLVGYDGTKRVEKAAGEIRKRFNVDVSFADGSAEDKNSAIADKAEVVFAAGRAGVQILSTKQIASSSSLIIAADVNAVPPAGIEGLDMQDDGKTISGSKVLAIGPLAIGQVKYQTESRLFKRMIETEKALSLDFRDAYELAKTIAG